MNPTRGILYKMTALFLFSIMAALIKAASSHVPAYQAVFFRSFFALVVIVIWLLLRRELNTGLKVKNPMGHVWRGLIGTTSMTLAFAGLAILPLPEATAIGFTAPLLIVIFAAMFLGEQIRLIRLSAVGIGLVGVGIILYPRLTLFGAGETETLLLLGAVLTLGSAVFRALASIHIRKLAQDEQTSAIVFYFSLTATCLSLLTLPLGWVMPTTPELIYLVMAGLIGGLAQICLTTSYKYAEASLMAPLGYMSMIYAMLLGYFVFSEIPTLPTLAGSALIILGGAVIIWRERQLRQRRKKTEQAASAQS